VIDLPPIVIDTREQLPYDFKHPSVIRTLKTGDYSIEGLENSVVVERKRHNEIVQCMTWGRERFERELERARNFRRFHLVIEASTQALMDGLYEDWPNGTHINSIRGTLIAWCNRFDSLRIWTPGTRVLAIDLVEHILKKAWTDDVSGKT
jgi:DNA excision repair protein ERCC-4